MENNSVKHDEADFFIVIDSHSLWHITILLRFPSQPQWSTIYTLQDGGCHLSGNPPLPRPPQHSPTPISCSENSAITANPSTLNCNKTTHMQGGDACGAGLQGDGGQPVQHAALLDNLHVRPGMFTYYSMPHAGLPYYYQSLCMRPCKTMAKFCSARS